MKALVLIATAGLGVFLISDGSGRAAALMEQRELNPLELKQSPYGEIIGAALQEPVHLLSHGGTGHEHVVEDNHEDCTGKAGCATCDANSQESQVPLAEGHGHGHDHDHEHEILDAHDTSRPWLALHKSKLASLEAKTRQNHNPGRRTADVRAYERKRMQELIELAYGMDPTNYANYMMYVDFEGRRGGFDRLFEISDKSLQLTEGRLNDPNDALTAAAAAEMIMIYREIYATRRGEKKKNPQIVSDYNFFLQKVREYVLSFDRALKEGRLEQYTQEKVDEMVATYERFDWTIKAYKKYIEEE
jgi:hypothetical protein